MRSYLFTLIYRTACAVLPFTVKTHELQAGPGAVFKSTCRTFHASLADARKAVPPGLKRYPPADDDGPDLVEVWA